MVQMVVRAVLKGGGVCVWVGAWGGGGGGGGGGGFAFLTSFSSPPPLHFWVSIIYSIELDTPNLPPR